MADWASAIAQGVGAAALTGADLIGSRIKMDQQLEAEQRAADLKLDLQQRMAAADEMMKNRAAERFSGYVRDAASEELPVEPRSIQETGITAESGKALGKRDYGNGPEDVAGLTGSADRIRGLMEGARAKLADPNLTAEQRADYQLVVDQLTTQVLAQEEINKRAAAGIARKRSLSEATEAAREYALQNDPAAFAAGNALLGPGEKQAAADKAFALREADAERKERQATADRESREAIAAQRDSQREKAADQRFQAMMARLEANGGGSAGSKSATVQTLEFLRDQLGWSKEKIGEYLTTSKHSPVEDIYLKLKASNEKSFGGATEEELMAMARSTAAKLRGATEPSPTAPKTLTYDPKTGTFK